MDKVYQAEQELIKILGYEDLYKQLSKSLGTDLLESHLAFIARMNDIELSVEIEE